MSIRSKDPANRRLPKKMLIKTYHAGKFTRGGGAEVEGILYTVTPATLVWNADGKEVISLKALISKSKVTQVHGYKAFPEGALASKLTPSADEPLHLHQFASELLEVKKAVESIPSMKLLWQLGDR